MKAIIQDKRGADFSTMYVGQIKASELGSNQVRIRLASSRINPVDADLLKGFPMIKYKKPQLGGVDGAGTIIEVGKQVVGFKTGDKVFFYRAFNDIGTWAEEITIPANHVAIIPSGLSVVDAGAVALPILTAYEALLLLEPKLGESILIHGAGGGVGFQAVLLAKAIGLKVIANASATDADDLVKAGVDLIIDYKKNDFAEVLANNKPNLVFDVLGKQNLEKSILLGPRAVVSTSFPDRKKMYKTGLNVPGIIKFLIGLSGKKMVKLANKNNVKLFGQITGPNGVNLNAASKLANSINYFTRNTQKITLDDVAKNGLKRSDVGKVIVFS